MEKVFVKFSALGLEINIPVIKINETTFNYPILRPIPQSSVLSQGDYTMNISKQEFMTDIAFQIPKKLDGSISEIAFESLYNIIVRHIKQFGRILPNDLDAYIGLNILLFDNMQQSAGQPALNKAQKEDTFVYYHSIAGSSFRIE